MSSHKDHGHGHADHHEHVEDRNRPLIVAAVIIIAFCGGAYYLAQTGTAARAATHGAVEPSGASSGHAGHGHAGADRAGAAAPAKQDSDRESFVATFDERQRKLGFTLQAKAAGANQETFEVRWDGTPEPGKIEALKNAAQLHVEARSRGFKKIAIVVNGKTVWEKAL